MPTSTAIPSVNARCRPGRCASAVTSATSTFALTAHRMEKGCTSLRNEPREAQAEDGEAAPEAAAEAGEAVEAPAAKVAEAMAILLERRAAANRARVAHEIIIVVKTVAAAQMGMTTS